ncbi:MAG: hypothetical protein WD049_05065 [Candidatus Paceibacterota bacterium]
MPYKNISKACLEELQTVIDLLREEKFFGAESVCEIVSNRFSSRKEVSKECLALVADLEEFISRKGEKSLEEITQQYRQLTGALS